MHTLAICEFTIFLDVCTLVKSQIASVCTGLNQVRFSKVADNILPGLIINPGKILSATLEKQNDAYKTACSTDL